MTHPATSEVRSRLLAHAAAGVGAGLGSSEVLPRPGLMMEPGAYAVRPGVSVFSSEAAETREAHRADSGASSSPVSDGPKGSKQAALMEPLDFWEGVFGRYPIPAQFQRITTGHPAKMHRATVLRELGDFYHWLYQQEARAAARFVGMQRRKAKKAGA